MEADVVVIGYGGAGAVAAITAFDSGGEVLVLEKSPSLSSLGVKPDRRPATRISGGGGNTHISMGTVSCPSSVSDAANYLFSACGGQTPMDVCKAWAEEVCKNAEWLREMGIRGAIVEDSPREYASLPGAAAMNIYRIKGWGQALFSRLDEHIQERGIKVRFHTQGKALIQDHSTREVIGVRAEHRGKPINIKAKKGTVLCTGGFEFNEDMKNRFLKCWPMKFYGWGFNTGDGIKMAQKAGADLWHMDVIAGGNCSWFGDPEYDFGISTSTKTDNYLWVNKFGTRFCDEPRTWHPHGGWVAHLERNTAYPGYSRIPSYLVFDETAMRAGPIGADEAVRKGGFNMGRRLLPPELGGYEGWSEDNLKELERGWIKKGSSIGELAAAIGGEMNPALLRNTIEIYNNCCAEGDDPEFGRCPEKLCPVNTPPYYAVPLYPGLVCTLGGPRRNARAEVLAPDGNAIPRLFSAGNCGSIYGRTYSVGGGNLGELCAFGRIAGRNVADLEPWM